MDEGYAGVVEARVIDSKGTVVVQHPFWVFPDSRVNDHGHAFVIGKRSFVQRLQGFSGIQVRIQQEQPVIRQEMADRLCPREIEFMIKVFSGIVPVQVLHFFQKDRLFIGNIEGNSIHGNAGDCQEKVAPCFFFQLRFQKYVVAGGGIVTGDDAPEGHGGMKDMMAVVGDEVEVHMVFHQLVFRKMPELY